LSKYPERESKLFDILRNGLPSIDTVESTNQELSFHKLFLYYEEKGISLNKNTFEKNLGLLTKNGKYNLLAQMLSDNSGISVRVSIFSGKDKASPLYSVKEFGNTCLLLSLDKVLEYGDVLNIMQADEKERVVERKEVPLFNKDAFREAVINSFVHNLWVDQNAPMITVYSDRMEILSRGTLAPAQTLKGFYLGESVPVNKSLSDIFLQLHISERSGRGVPVITAAYGKEAFEFREKSIVVTLPFRRIHDYGVIGKANFKVDNKVCLNSTRTRILKEIQNNPNIKQTDLAALLGISRTAVQKNLVLLRENGYIERVGSKKRGYWRILE